MNWFRRSAYRVIKGAVKLVYPRITVEGAEHIPDGPFVAIGNHSQLHGPIISELYFPVDRYTWCAGEMMHLKEVPPYAFCDFWSKKPKRTHWFYKILSYLIAPLAVIIFNNAQTIGVYHDRRIIGTFRESLNKLSCGSSVVIFPEYHEKNNRILYKFRDGFVDIGRMYYKKTGKRLNFVPVYMAPKLHKMCFGKPIAFDPDAPIENERARISSYLSEQITDIAVSQPRHKVIPYENISKKDYPYNKEVDEK